MAQLEVSTDVPTEETTTADKNNGVSKESEIEAFVREHCVVTTSTTEEKRGNCEDRSDAAANGGETANKSLGSTVAKHYNLLQSNTKDQRKDSCIFHLRNFNNWVKTVVINEFMEKINAKKRVSDELNVLDLACGKGGDLLKWKNSGEVDHVIMADIAEVSIEQCKERYSRLKRDHQRNRNYGRQRNNYNQEIFTAEFFATDCTKTKLSELYRRRNIKLYLSSCQFAFHYSFESYEQADIMLRNLCDNLRVGGYFIGTTPDSQTLVKRMKNCESESFGNSLFNIKPESKDSFPLFGSKYFFHLEGVVDCPEFLVYFPLLEKMAEKYDMKLVWKKNFHDIFKEFQEKHKTLLNRMNVLEKYPSGEEKQTNEEQYKSAKDYMAQTDLSVSKTVGTLSLDEWEVAGLYVAFAFEKIDPVKERARIQRDQLKRSMSSQSCGSSEVKKANAGGQSSVTCPTDEGSSASRSHNETTPSPILTTSATNDTVIDANITSE